MKIIFNEQAEEIKNNTTLEQFLSDKKLNNQSGIAVALNNRVIPRDKWPLTVLNPEDALLVIGASYGG